MLGRGGEVCPWCLVGPHRCPSPLLASSGGYLFTIAPLSESEGVALFTPAGWFHWLVGDGAAAPTDGDGAAAAAEGGAAAEGDGVAAEEAAAGSASDWHVCFGGSYPPSSCRA